MVVVEAELLSVLAAVLVVVEAGSVPAAVLVVLEAGLLPVLAAVNGVPPIMLQIAVDARLVSGAAMPACIVIYCKYHGWRRRISLRKHKSSE